MKTATNIALAAALMLGCGGPSVVREACLGPLALNAMPDLDMLVGDTVETSLLDYFGDPMCYPEFSYAARSADPAVAASISGTDLTIAAIEEADSVRVEVTATNLGGSAAHDFYVRVEVSTER